MPKSDRALSVDVYQLGRTSNRSDNTTYLNKIMRDSDVPNSVHIFATKMLKAGLAEQAKATVELWNEFADRNGAFADDYSTL